MRNVFLLCILIIACSCARKGLPMGGPADVTPPRVVSSSPDSGAVGVKRVSEISIAFSERMDKRTVRDVVVVRPRVEVKEVRWRKSTFCLVLADSLDASTTYSVLAMGGCRDAHGNHMKSPYVSAFSTGDTLLAGRIDGSVQAKGLPASGIPVWAFDSLKCPEPDFAKDEPHYVSQSGAGGNYKFIGLPSAIYLLYVFKDKDANRAYDEETDFVSPAPAPVRITPEETQVSGVEIALVDPNATGQISGVVEHCMAETVLVAVVATSTEDSLVSHFAPMKSDSSFTIGSVPPGRYCVFCYADLNLNETHDPPEEPRCLEVHFVQVFPEETTSDVTLAIPCPEGPTVEEESGVKETEEREQPPEQMKPEDPKDEGTSNVGKAIQKLERARGEDADETPPGEGGQEQEHEE